LGSQIERRFGHFKAAAAAAAAAAGALVKAPRWPRVRPPVGCAELAAAPLCKRAALKLRSPKRPLRRPQGRFTFYLARSAAN